MSKVAGNKRKAREASEAQGTGVAQSQLPAKPTPAAPHHASADSAWTAPTPEEWKTVYKKYRSFKLPGSEENYKVGDFIYILPPPIVENPQGKRKRPSKDSSASAGQDDTDVVEVEDEANDPDANPWWIGEISEVRAKNDRSVFMKVNWMYTTIAQLKSIGAKKIPKRVEGYEVFYSKYSDVQPVHALADRAAIHRFDESQVVQDPIPIDAVFYRSEVVPPEELPTPPEAKRKGKKRAPVPAPVIQPLCPPSCFCGKPYTPLPLDTAPMVYCPSPGCRKWLHTRCLERERREYDRTPDRVAKVCTSGLDLVAELPPPSTPNGADTERDETAGDRIQVAPEQPLSKAIRKAAEESIVRGSSSTGLVGNGQKVILARDILARSASGENVHEATKAWTEKFGEDGFKNLAKGDAKGVGGLGGKTWLCPSCQCFI